MTEHLELRVRLLPDIGNFPDGEFPGEHHAGNSRLTGRQHTLGIMKGHLGAGMQRDVRVSVPQQPRQTDILDNDRVHAALPGTERPVHGRRELLSAQKGV